MSKASSMIVNFWNLQLFREISTSFQSIDFTCQNSRIFKSSNILKIKPTWNRIVWASFYFSSPESVDRELKTKLCQRELSQKCNPYSQVRVLIFITWYNAKPASTHALESFHSQFSVSGQPCSFKGCVSFYSKLRWSNFWDSEQPKKYCFGINAIWQ